MKKFVLAALAATLVATPVLAAPNHGSNHDNRSRVEQNHRSHAHQQRTQRQQNWNRGDRFEQRRATNYRVINNHRAYKLRAPARGYRWVQSGRDALLINVRTNIISQVVRNAVR